MLAPRCRRCLLFRHNRAPKSCWRCYIRAMSEERSQRQRATRVSLHERAQCRRHYARCSMLNVAAALPPYARRGAKSARHYCCRYAITASYNMAMLLFAVEEERRYFDGMLVLRHTPPVVFSTRYLPLCRAPYATGDMLCRHTRH